MSHRAIPDAQRRCELGPVFTGKMPVILMGARAHATGARCEGWR